jgi:hypothetical protein
MEWHIPSGRSHWKAVGLWLLLIITLPAATLTAAEPTDPEGLRQLAVSQYIEGATKELGAFGQQINEAARPENQEQCKEAKAKLDECNELLKDLKMTDAEQFDQVKAKYEHTRGELVKALQAAQTK